MQESNCFFESGGIWQDMEGFFTDSPVLCKSWFGNLLPVISRSCCWGLSKIAVMPRDCANLSSEAELEEELFLQVIKRGESGKEWMH